MNINRIGNGVNGISGHPASRPVDDGAFRALPESRMRPLSSADGLDELPGVGAVTAAAVDPETRIAALSLSERAIGELEDYQKALANLDIKEKDLAPFISALEERVLGLLELREQIPAGDGLAAVVDRVAATCYLETVKYRRGDFSA
jgi:hypothetical protein